MRSRIIGFGRAAGYVAISIVAAVPAYAADIYELQRKDSWKVGDVVTTTVDEKDERELRFVTAEGSALAQPAQTILVQAKLFEKCLEVDAAGNRVRALVYVVAWTAQDGPTKDTSLAGALLDVTGLGKDRAARVASSKEELSKAASAWLGHRYGGTRPEPSAARAYWLPKAPVAVGDTWSADLAAFLDANVAGPRLDRSKTTSACVLTSVNALVATVTCEASLALASFPGNKGGKPIPWKSGGIQTLKGTITMGLEGRLAPSTLKFTSSLEGEAEMGGQTVSLSFKTNRTIDEIVGGEWPATVKLPDPSAPVPSVSDPKPPTPSPAPVPSPEPGMAGMSD